MTRITLYLDDATAVIVAQAARSSRMSKSRWVVQMIRRHGPGSWPAECLKLAGAFTDFPLRENADTTPATDATRRGF